MVARDMGIWGESRVVAWGRRGDAILFGGRWRGFGKKYKKRGRGGR